MMNINILIPLIVALLMVPVVTIASGYPYLQAKLSILFSGSLVFVLASVQLAGELRLVKHRPDEQKLEHKGHADAASVLQYGLELAWMVGFGLTIYLLGFIIAIPLYICAYMKSHGSRWLASVTTGGFMAAFCYGIFVLILDMKLHNGLIFIRWGF